LITYETPNQLLTTTTPQQSQWYPPKLPFPPPLPTDTNTPREQATTLRSIKSLVPLLDRVLVQRVKAEAKTASGLFLPESSVKELNEARVLAVGPGGLDKDGKRLPMGVSQGDRVLIPQYGGAPVKVGEEEFTLFRDSE
jgi:chaperonin GroES